MRTEVSYQNAIRRVRFSEYSRYFDQSVATSLAKCGRRERPVTQLAVAAVSRHVRCLRDLRGVHDALETKHRIEARARGWSSSK